MKQTLEQAIARAVKDVFKVEIMPELTRPAEQFGDYATNVALQIAKQVNKNPREIAETLAVNVRERLASELADLTVAGAGFLNLTLTDRALAATAAQLLPKKLAGQTIVVEYSDPNPFKPLHAGHLYTTLVGDTIARLIEHAGATTIRINYGGDVGLHVAKSMWAIIKNLGGELPDKLAEITTEQRSNWLGARYVEGTDAYEDDPVARAEITAINKRVYQLHANGDHDSPFATLYWTCRQWSYDYFAQLYQQLQVTPFDRYIPESEVTGLGVRTVEEQLKQGVFERSDGAVIFDGEAVGLHTRVFINSAGLPTYETKDIGLSLTKWRDYHFDASIIITANEQEQYMKVVVAALGVFEPEPAARTKHLTHGSVKLQGGVKMSSRKGNVLLALDILAVARAAGQATATNPSEDTILAAVKYAFAKTRIGSDIVYDPKESVALEGNSGPYLQYAHARARSILAKASGARSELVPASRSQAQEKAAPSFEEILQQGQVTDRFEPAERSLVRKISEYNEVVEKAVAELLPHYICTYLYELAQSFNRFYEHNRVIGDAREAIRLQLVKHYADTLRDGLALLGIAAPDHM